MRQQRLRHDCGHIDGKAGVSILSFFFSNLFDVSRFKLVALQLFRLVSILFQTGDNLSADTSHRHRPAALKNQGLQHSAIEPEGECLVAQKRWHSGPDSTLIP